jgi:hypothetical protein
LKTPEYVLEIYEPGKAYDVWAAFTSAAPFMGIRKGDLINPGTWTDSMHPKELGKVVGVEHIIFESERKIVHKLCVFLEAAPNTPESKLNRPF